MSDQVIQHNIGAVVVEATSIFPVASAAATVNGVSIDRFAHQNPLSCVLHTAVGAESGAPSGVSVQSTLQHAPDNSTWTTFKPDGVNNATGAAITAVNTDQNYSVDLALAYRYLRVQTVVSFTGGTSPTIGLTADLVLGGEQLLAAV